MAVPAPAPLAGGCVFQSGRRVCRSSSIFLQVGFEEEELLHDLPLLVSDGLLRGQPGVLGGLHGGLVSSPACGKGVQEI